MLQSSEQLSRFRWRACSAISSAPGHRWTPRQARGIDPQSEAIAQALAFVGIELMAAFGAGWCGVRLPGAHVKPVAASRAAGTARGTQRAADAASPAAGGPGEALMGELVKSDRPMPFRALYEQYEAGCRAAGAEPKTKRAVGRVLSDRFEKTKGGDVTYYARPRLTAVNSSKAA